MHHPFGQMDVFNVDMAKSFLVNYVAQEPIRENISIHASRTGRIL